MKQERVERLRRAHASAREDYERAYAGLRALQQADPDNEVEIAMLRPMVEAAAARLAEIETRLRAAEGGVSNRVL